MVVGYEDHVHVFCFSALAQSGIALLLPGYILLVGAIDLGYRRLLQATGRVVFVAFYSLWLGAGLTMGIWLFSVIWLTKHSHVDKLLTCDAAPADIPAQLQWLFDPVLGGSYYRLLIVWSFASVISLYNFATWKQLPAMLFVAVPGFATTFFAANAFSSVPHFASFFGTAASGTLGYLYAHFARQPAIVYLFTAIWLQVPSGLAANGGLYSGLKAAESIANVHGNGTTQAGAGLDHTRTHGDGQWGGKHIMDLYLGMLCVAIAVFFGLGVAKGVAAGIVWVWETFRVRVLRRKRSRKVGGAQFGF